jgi:Arc/MetJ family transcription regulator
MSKRIHIHLDDEIVHKVQALSLQEDRTVSNMVRVLLKEALKKRKILGHQLNKAKRLLKKTGT